MYDEDIEVPDFPDLFGIASEQAGYFTAAQAHAAGYSKQLLAYHVTTGRFIRQRRGLYRLRDYPSSRHEEVMVAWLAVGKDSAVVSHESALDLLNLSDVVPHAVHLTVPRSRRGLPRMRLVALHTTIHPLLPRETTTREGIRITDPMRSILDSAEYGTASEQVVMAIRQAIGRGLLLGDALRALSVARGTRVAQLVAYALECAPWP